MTNADVIRRMDNNQLYEFLSEWEDGDIDYAVTFCDLCKKDGNELHLDCDGCRKHWLNRDAVEYGGLLYWKKNQTYDYNTVGEWIPVKYHEITEEEREENGYPKDWVYLLDCEMPQDEQEILVQVKNGEIRWDVCYLDDGFSLDSGWDWADDVVAWMPLPEPYKGGDTE